MRAQSQIDTFQDTGSHMGTRVDTRLHRHTQTDTRPSHLQLATISGPCHHPASPPRPRSHHNQTEKPQAPARRQSPFPAPSLHPGSPQCPLTSPTRGAPGPEGDGSDFRRRQAKGPRSTCPTASLLSAPGPGKTHGKPRTLSETRNPSACRARGSHLSPRPSGCTMAPSLDPP